VVCDHQRFAKPIARRLHRGSKSAALAFLDFHLEGRWAAHTWLQNLYLKIASSGIAGLERK
jgi:hypothetical protein